MKDKVFLGARLLLGAVFIIFGLNGFLGFIPTPPPSPEAGALLGAFAATGYFFPFIKVTEILVGVALVSGLFVPLALAIIFPIVVGIFQIHLFLAPSGLPIAIVLLVLHLVSTYANWDAYRSVVKMK